MTLLNKLASPFQTGDKGKVIGVVEPISIRRQDGSEEEGVLAKIDTGEDHSQIDKKLAQELGLYSSEQVVDRITAEIDGRERLVEQIEISFTIDGDWLSSHWLVLDLADEKQLVVLGKEDLRGYLVRIP